MLTMIQFNRQDVNAVSGRRAEVDWCGILSYLWLAHEDVWWKGGKRSGLEGGNEREETGTPVDPQTGELAINTGVQYHVR